MLEAAGISASWNNETLFDSVSLSVDKGKTVAILGPNGCGKTTLLSVLSGQKKADSGTVLLSGIPVKAGDRRLSCILQTYGIFPWMTVEENINLPLKISGNRADDIKTGTDSVLSRFALSDYRKRYPLTLSGGEKQKLALARSLVTSPYLLLMDEPFSAIDTITREELQVFLRQLLAERETASVIVTHSVEEAVFLSDQVYVMKNKPSSGLAAVINITRNFQDRKEDSFLQQVKKTRSIMEGCR